MRRILFIIFILFSCVGNAQYTKNILTSGSYPSGPGYPAINNLAIAFGVHIDNPNANGKKHIIYIWLSGHGERGPAGDTLTSAGLAKVASVDLPAMVANAQLGNFVAPGGGTTDSLGGIVIFPQCSTAYGVWPPAYSIEMILWAKANLANVGDTNRIIIIGYSLGACGISIALGNTFIRENTAGMFGIAPGCYGATNRQQISDSLPPTYYYHAANDGTAPISNPDGFIGSLNPYRPVNPIQYFVFSGVTPGFSGHGIQAALLNRTGGAQAALRNGDTYTHVPFYSIACTMFKKRYKR